MDLNYGVPVKERDRSPIWPKNSACHTQDQNMKEQDTTPCTTINGSYDEEGSISSTNESEQNHCVDSTSRNTLDDSPPFQINPIHQVFHNLLPQPSDVYTGVIRNSRFDFITEEPHKKRLKRTSVSRNGTTPYQEETSSSQKSRGVDESLPGPFDTLMIMKNLAGYGGIENNLDLSEDNCSTQRTVHESNGAWADLPTDGTGNLPTSIYQPEYSWQVQPKYYEKTPYESTSAVETIERPATETLQYMQSTYGSAIPSINSFTTAFDQYGCRGMTFFPMMYPASLPTYPMQYYPMFPNADPYFLLRDRYKDVEPYIFPTFIQPKPFTRPLSLRPFTEALPPTPYPNPAAMFQAANLIPPRMSSSARETKPAVAVVTNPSPAATEEPSKSDCEYDGRKIQPKLPLPQSTWLKADSGLNYYTVAAAPSDVMTYLPQRANEEEEANDVDRSSSAYSSSSSSSDEDDADENSQIHEEHSIIDLVVKKTKAPSRKPHICDICGKTYARAFTLKTHQRVHTGERPYTCKICFKRFAQGGGLDSHMRVHTGEKPYKCPLCDRAFSHSSAVKSHLRRHTGEKPFSCNVCGKKFGDQSTLTKHNRTHTGEKPFQCHICHVTFSQIGNMNKHLKKIHDNRSRHGYASKRQHISMFDTKNKNIGKCCD